MSDDDLEALQEIIEEVAYHRSAGECLAAFYEGLRTRIGEHELRIDLLRHWMWHYYPMDDGDEEGS